MLKVVPVKKSSASDQVFEQLKDNLIQGTWKPGEKLASENELASLFGVSRITIRQALSRLAALGLVETRLGEGSFVAEPKPGMYMQSIIPAVFLGSSISDDFERELLEFRVVNEVATAKLAVDHATDEDLEKLTYLRNEMVRAAECNDIARYTGADFQFHEAISAMTHNSIVMAVHSILSDALRHSIHSLTSVVGVENGLRSHKRLLEAFLARDAEEAQAAMQEHLGVLLEDQRKRREKKEKNG